MRTVRSREPVTIPPRTEQTYPDMEATRIHFYRENGKTRLHVRFDATDGTSILPGHAFKLDFADVKSRESGVPRLVTALDNLHTVLGLYYTRTHAQKEIQDIDPDDPNYIAKRDQLRAVRDAADADLAKDPDTPSR